MHCGYGARLTLSLFWFLANYFLSTLLYSTLRYSSLPAGGVGEKKRKTQSDSHSH